MKKLLMLTVVFSFTAFAEASLSIKPGEIKLIDFPTPKPGSKFKCRNQEVKYLVKGEKAQAVIVESYFSNLKPFKCLIETDGKVIQEISFSVVEKQYKAETLKVDPKRIKLSPKDQNRAASEQLVLNQIYASSVPEFLFSKPFMQPLKSTVTSVYGTKRVYNNQKKGQHLGIDYRAAIGDKVPAANRGKVVFAGDLFYTGYTVIIDHGMDIFTVYGHLSETLVERGAIVEKGDIIALSGNTGRTSGPHLHWGVKIQGEYVDGMSLIAETEKIFSE